MPIFTTACPCNCYSTCSLQVEIEQGCIRRILPHPDNAATRRGPCLKGLSHAERQISPDRLLHPLARTSGSKDFHRISWPEALDQIAEKLASLRAIHGPQSIFFYEGSGTKGLLNSVAMNFWHMFGGCTTAYGDLCWPAGLEATRLTLGANKHNAPWDLVHARLIVLWGKNPAETNLHQMPFIEEAIARGARLVAIDPRRTESAEKAELLIQPRPGSDGALALGIAHSLIRNHWNDDEFIARHVLGYDEFAHLVSAYTPERTAEETDVPAHYIEQLAELIGTHKPVTICAGFGMQRYTNGGQTVRAILSLLAITGNLGKSGAGWQFANLQSDLFEPAPPPPAVHANLSPGETIRSAVSAARFGRDVLDIRDPEIKMIWVERANPLAQNPDTNVCLKAMRGLEFRVVIDQFMTDTAREADIVLPAKSLFEQSDIIGSYWHPYIQLRRKILDCPGEVKPETEIYRLLSERLNFPQPLINAHLPGNSDAEIDAWLRARLAGFPDLTLERLQTGPVLAPGCEEIAFADLIFSTPSGKIELLSKDAAQLWKVAELPEYQPPVESPFPGNPYPLRLLTPNTKNRIHSQFGNLRMIRAIASAPALWISPADARARSIFDGDPVRMYNDRGSLETTARIDFSLKSGCVFMTNGGWMSEGGAVNFLSLGRETDMGHGAAFHDNLVEIAPIRSSQRFSGEEAP